MNQNSLNFTVEKKNRFSKYIKMTEGGATALSCLDETLNIHNSQEAIEMPSFNPNGSNNQQVISNI